MKRAIPLSIMVAVCGCRSPEPPNHSRPYSVTESVLKPLSPLISEDSERVRTYTVQRGDTLSRIANKVYGDPTLWRYIHDANHLPGVNIEVGQALIIPDTNDTLTASIAIVDALPEAAPTQRQSYAFGSLSVYAQTVSVKPDGSLVAEGDVVIESDEDTLSADAATIEQETGESILVILTGNAKAIRSGRKYIYRGSYMKRWYKTKTNSQEQE